MVPSNFKTLKLKAELNDGTRNMSPTLSKSLND